MSPVIKEIFPTSGAESAPAHPELSVVIPAYLEEENLRILLPRITGTLASEVSSFEVVIVDTETPLDGTKLVCKGIPQVRYINRTGGNSFGDAVRSGIAAARGRYILFMDADGSHSPEFILELYKERENHDVVIASRYIDGGCTENSRTLVLMSRILNLTYRYVLNLSCFDVSNSFKIYRAEQLKAIELKCDNFDIVEEILYKLNKRFRISIKEIPSTFKKRMFGDTKRNLVAFIFTYFFTLLKLRFGN